MFFNKMTALAALSFLFFLPVLAVPAKAQLFETKASEAFLIDAETRRTSLA